jgi:hypothetical protein
MLEQLRHLDLQPSIYYCSSKHLPNLLQLTKEAAQQLRHLEVAHLPLPSVYVCVCVCVCVCV